MLPTNNPKFEAFFSSISLTDSPDPAKRNLFEVVPSVLSTDGKQHFEARPLFLSYDVLNEISPESAIRIISKELTARSHLDETSVASAVLAIYANTVRTSGTSVQILNQIISTITNAEVSDYLIAPFPIFPGFQSFSFGDFEAGALNYDHLKYWCERVKCDYFKRYPDRHRGNFAVQRKRHKIRLIDFSHIKSSFPSNYFERLADNYFEAVTRCLYARFRAEAWTAQEILIAFGAPFIDFNDFQFWNGSTFICLFNNIGLDHAGYFCPIGNGLAINYSGIDTGIPKTKTLLEKSFGFIEPESNQIGTTLQTFCRFIATSRMHESASRISESFLHHAIALDLLFGDREGISLSVSRRTAVCLYGDHNDEYEKALKRVKSLYDFRSRYVHSGIIINAKALEEIKEVSNAVLRCLMRFHSAPVEDLKQKEIVWWHRQLDYIASGLEAGKEPSMADLRGLGLRKDMK
jgi:hypothetical protein